MLFQLWIFVFVAVCLWTIDRAVFKLQERVQALESRLREFDPPQLN